MKLKSLFLGTVAAAGLSTGAFAADLGVLTSLDVCDNLGLSGLTISSGDAVSGNCLQISGGVSYEFNWGDYRHAASNSTTAGVSSANAALSAAGYAGSDLVIGHTPFGNIKTLGSSENAPSVAADQRLDYDSKVEAWLKFVGTADSDFGPAKAVIKLKSVSQTRYINEGYTGQPTLAVGTTADSVLAADRQTFDIDEAYVSIGDSTVIMAGKKSSIAKFDDSEPFNFTKLFGWGAVDGGIGFDADGDRVSFTGDHVIQVVSDLGNGLNVGVGLENLQGKDTDGVLTAAKGAGTLVGVLSYAGEGITAHLTGLAVGVLDGQVDQWGIHAGATGTFENFRIRAAVGYLAKDYTSIALGSTANQLHALLSGDATFDIFTVALSGEYARTEKPGTVTDGFGVGGSIGATVTDGVKINLGARYFGNRVNNAVDSNTVQVAAQLVAAVTETITITGEVGAYWNDTTLVVGSTNPLVYGAAQLAWAPGGGFTTSLKGEVNSDGAYRATYKAAKSFE